MMEKRAFVVSISWVIWFFVLGGFAGVVIAVLMSMAAREEERALQSEDALRKRHAATLT
jgi:protein-S-isoprenylcysteine O-methyltransferase Ste14